MSEAERLWQDYEFLTREMDKFITRHQLDMFVELTKQRETLQEKIDHTEDVASYRLSPQGKAKIAAVSQLNQQIQLKLLQFRNHSLQQQSVSNAYEGLGQGISGNFFNRST